MIAGALGVRPLKKSDEEKESDRKKFKDARDTLSSNSSRRSSTSSRGSSSRLFDAALSSSSSNSRLFNAALSSTTSNSKLFDAAVSTNSSGRSNSRLDSTGSSNSRLFDAALSSSSRITDPTASPSYLDSLVDVSVSTNSELDSTSTSLLDVAVPFNLLDSKLDVVPSTAALYSEPDSIGSSNPYDIIASTNIPTNVVEPVNITNTFIPLPRMDDTPEEIAMSADATLGRAYTPDLSFTSQTTSEMQPESSHIVTSKLVDSMSDSDGSRGSVDEDGVNVLFKRVAVRNAEEGDVGE